MPHLCSPELASGPHALSHPNWLGFVCDETDTGVPWGVSYPWDGKLHVGQVSHCVPEPWSNGQNLW